MCSNSSNTSKPCDTWRRPLQLYRLAERHIRTPPSIPNRAKKGGPNFHSDSPRISMDQVSVRFGRCLNASPHHLSLATFSCRRTSPPPMKLVAGVAGIQIIVRVLGELTPHCVLEFLRVLQRLIRQQVEIWIPTISSRKQLAQVFIGRVLLQSFLQVLQRLEASMLHQRSLRGLFCFVARRRRGLLAMGDNLNCWTPVLLSR
mmetsp:Transcript_29127/g.63296  ORF Transcript_29127/g.63296 Transcript_29127/m.63296 type:complete len:202 (+) Transcript_29127:94-699(+)